MKNKDKNSTQAQDPLEKNLAGSSGPSHIQLQNTFGLIINPATEDTLDDVKTAVEKIDNWDENDRAKVNPIVGQAGVQSSSGINTALTQRVTLATDIPLPAGTNVIGQIQISGGEGIGADTSLTLTDADTVYALPSSPPAVPYRLIIYNVSDTDVYVRDTSGTTLGILFPAGGVWTEDMGASEVKYLFCGSAGKIVNYSTKANQ